MNKPTKLLGNLFGLVVDVLFLAYVALTDSGPLAVRVTIWLAIGFFSLLALHHFFGSWAN
jgi:hypothetical protein